MTTLQYYSNVFIEQQQVLFPLGLTEICLQSYILKELGAWQPKITRKLEIHTGSVVYLRSPSLSLSCFGLLIGGVLGRGALLLFVSLLKKGELFLEVLATSLNTGEPICSCIYLVVYKNK